MHEVNVTELRNHLPQYLANVKKGDEILVTLRGEIIARILPPVDLKREARLKLLVLRKHAKMGDIISPIADKWEADT